MAVKLIHESAAQDPGFALAFYRAKIMAGLAPNPHVVTIYDMGETDERPYLVMEYLPGRTLKEIISDVSGTPLPQGWLLKVARQMLMAVVDAHAHGIVHRDIKPENVFVLRSHSGRLRRTVRNLPFLVKVLDLASRAQTYGSSTGVAHSARICRRNPSIYVSGAGGWRCSFPSL